jgi:hypothetical protein
MNRETLSKTSIFLVESQKLLGPILAHCLLELEIPEVYINEQVPTDLLNYMNQNNIDSAIIHVSAESEKMLFWKHIMQGKK